MSGQGHYHLHKGSLIRGDNLKICDCYITQDTAYRLMRESPQLCERGECECP
jgi:hypothetical protein